ERRAEQSDLDAADEGDHGRDIHVSPGEMAGERNVIQLVDEVAVVAAGVEVKDQLDGRDAGYQHSGAELPGGARFRHGVGGQADPEGTPACPTPGRRLPSTWRNARRSACRGRVRKGGPWTPASAGWRGPCRVRPRSCRKRPSAGRGSDPAPGGRRNNR